MATCSTASFSLQSPIPLRWRLSSSQSKIPSLWSPRVIEEAMKRWCRTGVQFSCCFSTLWNMCSAPFILNPCSQFSDSKAAFLRKNHHPVLVRIAASSVSKVLGVFVFNLVVVRAVLRSLLSMLLPLVRIPILIPIENWTMQSSGQTALHFLFDILFFFFWACSKNQK